MGCMCVCLLSSSIFIYARKTVEKQYRNSKSGLGGWEFSPLTVNANVLNKDSELILNVRVYVFNFGVTGSWEGVHFHIQVM